MLTYYFGEHFRKMKRPNIFLYHHFKQTGHSPSKIQPVEKSIYDPNSSSKLKNIKRLENEFKRHRTESLTLEFAILFISQCTKYRFPSNTDFSSCRREIAASINDFSNRWCKRENVEPIMP